MKAKDLTQADVGKWVTLRAQINEVNASDSYTPVYIDYDTDMQWLPGDTILEFTTPPPPAVQEVGDVFKNIGGNHPAEWTLSMIDGNACIMRYLTGHVSADYPLNPALWEFVRKGNQS